LLTDRRLIAGWREVGTGFSLFRGVSDGRQNGLCDVLYLLLTNSSADDGFIEVELSGGICAAGNVDLDLIAVKADGKLFSSRGAFLLAVTTVGLGLGGAFTSRNSEEIFDSFELK